MFERRISTSPDKIRISEHKSFLDVFPPDTEIDLSEFIQQVQVFFDELAAVGGEHPKVEFDCCTDTHALKSVNLNWTRLETDEEHQERLQKVESYRKERELYEERRSRTIERVGVIRKQREYDEYQRLKEIYGDS